MTAIISTVVGPRDCALALSVPIDAPRFFADLDDDASHDFVRHYARAYAGLAPEALWERYRPYAELAGEVATAAEATGVRVRRNATLDDFGALMATHAVVTLVAHSVELASGVHRVEFGDGLTDVATIAERIPPEGQRIIDLTVCRSVVLGEEIKRRRRACVVVMNRADTSMDFRIVVYQEVIRTIARRPMPFVDALTQVRVGLLEGGFQEMTRLETILQRFQDAPQLGRGAGDKTDAFRKELRAELRAIGQRNARLIGVCVAMLVTLFVGTMALVLIWLEHPARVAAILAATGVSIPWIIKSMVALWKQRVASDLLLALASGLDPDVVRSVIAIAAGELAGAHKAPVATPHTAREAGTAT